MPQYWEDNKGKKTLVVTYDELVPRFYKSEEHLRTEVWRHKKRGYGIQKLQRGGGTEKQACSNPQSTMDALEWYTAAVQSTTTTPQG